MAKVSHPNVVQVFDVGDVGDQVFLAMEYVRGRNLSAWLGEQHRHPREILPVMIDVARGLAAAHTAGLVHRDVKPGNILVDEHGRALIGDFGLAYAAAPSASSASADGDAAIATEPARDVSIDPAAGAAGTPSHMAPEQHAAGPIDARTDQFGFGVTLWQALLGKLPFDGPDLGALYLAKVDAPPRVPTRAGGRAIVPQWLAAACLRAMAPRPEDRFASMDDLIAALHPPRRRRRRRWLWIAAAATTIAVAALGTVRGTTGCETVAGEIADTWSNARRSTIAAVVEGAGGWLTPSWITAQQRIDEWTTQWVAVRQASCRTNLHATDDALDATHACLRERRSALATVLDLVEQGDAAVLRDLVASVAAVPSPHGCEDVGTARREPDGIGDRRRVHAATIARAEMLGRAGRHADGLAIAERAVGEADELDWAPLRAHAFAVRGTMLRGLGELERAHEVLESAHHLAQELGDDVLALSTATVLTHLVGWDRARVDDGEIWARHGFAALHRTGDDPIGEAALLDAEGAVLRRGARYDEARTKLERARARDLSQASAGQELRFASTLGQLAGLEISAGRYAPARASYDRALEIQTAVLGPEHPALATTVGGIAIVDHMLGHNASAKVLLERAIVLRERGVGSAHPQLAGPLNNLGIVLLRLGDYAGALEVHQRALAIRERSFDPDHADIAESLNNIGVVLQEQGRYPEAEVAFIRALTIHDRTLGADHPNNVGLLDNLGIVAREQGQLAKAERWHQRALGIADRRLGDHHLGTGNASLGLAEVLAATDRCADALPLLDRTETIYAGSGAEPSRRAEATFVRGRCTWLTGEREAGHALVVDARTQFEGLGDGGNRGLVAVGTWLREHDG